MPRPWPSSIVHKMFGERRCGPRNVAYGVGGAVFRCLNGRGGDSCTNRARITASFSAVTGLRVTKCYDRVMLERVCIMACRNAYLGRSAEWFEVTLRIPRHTIRK